MTTAVLLGLLIAGLAFCICLGTVWMRWQLRLRARRKRRLIERQAQRDELERALRRLRLRIVVRA